MSSSDKVFIVSGVRTPIASFRGSFATVSVDQLGATVVKEALTRSGVSPTEVEETLVGCVLAANCGQNVARQVATNADIPSDAQAVTINKVCSSSMKALAFAVLSIRSGYRKRVVVAGVENMSQTPYYLPRGETPYGGIKLIDGIAKDGLEDAVHKYAMGLCAEKTAREGSIDRKAQDDFAIQSYKKASSAWQNGLFAEEVMTVPVTQRGGVLNVSEDEEYKKLNESKVPTLRPVFSKDGTITAANASSLNDGAVAAVVVSGDSLPAGKKPLAEVVDFAEAGVDSIDFTAAPGFAVKKLLEKNKLAVSDIALWEVNEAFAVTVLHFIKELGISEELVNVKGGAVALGHPLGMSGLRVVVTLAYSLKPGQLGVATLCNGGGEAMAVLIRRPE
ncbi:unnamed protein product [Auanema sp. JU1783]|nr:unnamed protein product [Auanema sp. JU1783]